MAVTDEELRGVSSDRLLKECNRRGYIRAIADPFVKSLMPDYSDGPIACSEFGAGADAVFTALGCGDE